MDESHTETSITACKYTKNVKFSNTICGIVDFLSSHAAKRVIIERGWCSKEEHRFCQKYRKRTYLCVSVWMRNRIDI